MATITDDFNRANDATGLGADWTFGYSGGSMKIGISANQVYQLSTTAGIVVGRRQNDSFTGDQYAQVKVAALPNQAGTWVPGPAVRVSSSGFSFYGMTWNLAGSIVVKNNGGTNVISATQTINVNDVLRLEVASGVLTLKINGVAVGTPYNEPSPLTGPQIGLYTATLVGSETAWRLDDFEGGDLVASAPSGTIAVTLANVTLAASGTVATNATGTIAVTLAGVTMAASGVVASADGTITTEPLKNNTGTVLASETGVTVHVYETTGELVVTKTAQTTDADGIMAITDALIEASTEYRIVIVLGSGAEGMDRITAA